MELSLEEIARICAVYAETGSEKRTAEITCHSSTTVCKYVMRNGMGKGRGNHNQKITDAEIIGGILQGLTRQEIADKYGVHVENLARRMHKLGVRATYAKPVAKETRELAQTWHYSAATDRIIKEKFCGAWEFVAYKNRRVRMKCKACGEVVERDVSNVRRSNTICAACEEKKRRIEELARVIAAIAEKKTPKICPSCGEAFYSEYPEKRYCSKKCKRKKKAGASIRRRCRHYGVYYDPAVTAQKVFERDNMICQICGKPCDPEDKSWGASGALYPSVDHIIPLAKGGTHTWDNVQCVHVLCNSYKRDLITV